MNSFAGYVLVVSLIVGVGVFVLRRAYTRQALSLDWKPGLSSQRICSFTGIYLRKNGWKLLPMSGDRRGIRVRAEKNKQRIEIYTADEKTISAVTAMKDADEIAGQTGCTVIFLAYGYLSVDLRAVGVSRRVLVISPADLNNVGSLLHQRVSANRILEAKRLALLEKEQLIPPPDFTS